MRKSNSASQVYQDQVVSRTYDAVLKLLSFPHADAASYARCRCISSIHKLPVMAGPHD